MEPANSFISNYDNKDWSYKSRDYIESLDDICERIDLGYYHSAQSLISDIQFIVQKAIDSRA